MISKIIEELKLPPLKSREEMLDIILKEEYGYIPPKPESLTFEVTENIIRNFCAGKAKANKIIAKGRVCGREFSFPFYSVIPTNEGKYPFFVHVNFRDAIPDAYMPTEEIIDNGFAVLSFCYKDVTDDNDDFTDKHAGVINPDGKRDPSSAGKIALWTWAAHRVMDYAQTLDCLDLKNSVMCGHSRLGKTALLTAATDERFAFAYSNDSGCSGAAIARKSGGETIKDICKSFGYWFCENYNKNIDKESEMPFDQHYLISVIAPRCVCVGSASLDEWANPKAEMLNCFASSETYEKEGRVGFVAPDRFAEVGECFFEGSIGYHLREGLHYFGREDWNKLIAFVNKHKN